MKRLPKEISYIHFLEGGERCYELANGFTIRTDKNKYIVLDKINIEVSVEKALSKALKVANSS